MVTLIKNLEQTRRSLFTFCSLQQPKIKWILEKTLCFFFPHPTWCGNEPLAAFVRAGSPLTNKSDRTVGQLHCWMKQREKLNFHFQRVQEQHEVCRTNPGSIWRLLGFLGLPSGKSLHQKPSGNSTKREELLTLCQPHLSKKILLQP